MQFNLSSILSHSARQSPNQPFLITADEQYSYAEIDARAALAATVLARHGVSHGDAVLLRLPNRVDFVPYYFGLLRLGAVVVPVNPALSAREIAVATQDTGARFVILEDADDVALDPGVERLDIDALAAAERECESPTEAVAVDGDDTALVIFTSGTTGRPKGAELGHQQAFLTALLEGDEFGITAADVTLAVLPLFHIYGLSGILHSATLRGQSVFLMNGYSTAAVYDAIEHHGVTVLPGVPTMFHAMVTGDHSGRDLSGARIAISGGAPMPSETLRSLSELLPQLTYLEGYGMTETCSTGTVNGGPHPFRTDSIGRALWGVELAVVDASDQPLAAGPEHVGELVMRGHNIMKGYLGDPGATADALRSGWLHTGDLAWIDADGYVFIVGRAKELVIRGGFNVYPREVEEVLRSHEAVVDAAVVGRPDPHHGEELVAFVVAGPNGIDTHALIEFSSERLAAFKYPREVIIMDALPQGATGKIDKQMLVALATEAWQGAAS